ncbi:acetyl-CoA acetyltransferase [Cardiosporidium cionae]|uniref:Acetyl-CoA acetyltransferase n=1 Tax=Cardiosporidium cionae TaxID=476202 RepID=A0A3Q8UBA1_9APIC|nr:acetyl-CoA acyltransferase 1 [Cardiosporidium cionae]KAF8822722.1 acetyl-CoA acetyltransferase [Cardiosporidium cionae]|eukprot:KAF8822722.1 acetyl-CoA acetyltransferase [Cardiosporidium cionae]
MAYLRSFLPRDVFIVSMARTPVGSFLGALSSLTAPQLGAIALSNAIRRAHLENHEVEQVVMGHVLSGGCGQAPARQASLAADIPSTVDVFAVNKVCSSGMKAVVLAAQSIALRHCDIAVAGGMESMSQAPYLLRKAREGGYRYGHGDLLDSLLYDGLWDPHNNIHMGRCAEKTALEHSLSRVDQDMFAVESYKRSADAWKSGVMEKEIVPVTVSTGKKASSIEPSKISITEDEEYKRINLEKVATLKPAFQSDGTITAANASTLNDGAAAVVLMSGEKLKELDLQPLARILAFADAAVSPIDFPIAPFHAVKKVMKMASVDTKVDIYEINEAFSAVALANMKLLKVDPSRVNLHGGAVSLGHPLGMSGCRIIISLINVLHSHQRQVGCAAICNGGGGSTAMLLERM